MNAAGSHDEGTVAESVSEIVASFSSLAEAQQVIHSLTEAGIPTHCLSLVDHDPAAGQRALMVRRLAEAALVGGALGALIFMLTAIMEFPGTAASDLTIATIFLGAACGAAAGAFAVLVTGATAVEGDPRLVGGQYDLAVDPLVSKQAIAALQVAQRRG